MQLALLTATALSNLRIALTITVSLPTPMNDAWDTTRSRVGTYRILEEFRTEQYHSSSVHPNGGQPHRAVHDWTQEGNDRGQVLLSTYRRCRRKEHVTLGCSS